VVGDFPHSCGEFELSNGEPPHIIVGAGFEIDGLDCLMVPEQDQEHNFLLGTTI
jgi:hypothetical protein